MYAVWIYTCQLSVPNFVWLFGFPQYQWRTEESALWMIYLSLSKPSLFRMVLVSDIPLCYLGSSTEMVRNTHRHTHKRLLSSVHTAHRILKCSDTHFLRRKVAHFLFCSNIVLQIWIDRHNTSVTIFFNGWLPSSTTGEAGGWMYWSRRVVCSCWWRCE